MPHVYTGVARLACGQMSPVNAIWHLSLDETVEELENERIETDIFHMDHAMPLHFEARLAAVHEYRPRISDPDRRFAMLLAAPLAEMPTGPAAPAAVAQSSQFVPRAPAIEGAGATLIPEAAVRSSLTKTQSSSRREPASGRRGGRTKPDRSSRRRCGFSRRAWGAKPFGTLPTTIGNSSSSISMSCRRTIISRRAMA